MAYLFQLNGVFSAVIIVKKMNIYICDNYTHSESNALFIGSLTECNYSTNQISRYVTQSNIFL